MDYASLKLAIILSINRKFPLLWYRSSLIFTLFCVGLQRSYIPCLSFLRGSYVVILSFSYLARSECWWGQYGEGISEDVEW